MKAAGGKKSELMSDEEAQQSPLYLALAQSNSLHTFSQILHDESDPLWPFAQKALADYMGKHAFFEEDDLEQLARLFGDYGDKLLNLDVTTCFFEKCAPASRMFTPFIFDLVAHGRVLMRQSKGGAGSEFTVLTPFSTLIQTESHRKDPFCKSLLPFMNCLVPQVEPYSFGKSEKSLGQSEKAYGEFRGFKDNVLLAMAYWRVEFTTAVDPRSKVPQHQFELLRWIACMHLDAVCSASPAAAVRCLSSFATVLNRFHPALVSLFRDALLHCVDSGSGLLDALFPISKKEGGFETNSVADDPVRDLILLSENAHRNDQASFQTIIDKMTSTPLTTRQQFFVSSSSGSSFNLLSRRFVYDQASMSPWHRVMVRDIFFRILGKGNNAAQILSLYQAGQTIPLSMLFSNGNDTVWCVFVCWWQEHYPFVDTDKRLTKAISSVELCFPQMALDSFKEFGNSVESRSITVGAIPKDHSSLLHLTLGVMGLSNSSALCAALFREVEQKYNTAQNFKKISERFLPEDPCGAFLEEILRGWSSWTMNQLSCMFRESSDPAGSSRQLPATLVNSLHWVLFLMKSDFFERIWSLVEGPANLSRLEQTRRVWEDLFVSIEKKFISFPHLEDIIDFLSKEELETFYRSTRSQEFQKGNALSWEIRPRDGGFIQSLNDILNKWRHFRGVCQNLQVIGDCFPHFAQWLASGSKDKSLVASRNHVNSLCAALEENPWDMQSLADYDKFAADCEAIHPCLLQLHPAFFEKIAESTKFLDWLRTLPDDQDFTRGIEMAMGRSEMECPPELWLEEEGQPGRVNEQILSMVQSVRSYLHKFIFRESLKFSGADDFVNSFLAHLLKFEKTILVQMDRCNQYREPLMNLLSGGTENSAPGRLLRMLHPSSNAKWVCNSDGLSRTLEDLSSFEINSCLCLEYTAHDKSTRSLVVSEIEDFQSSVVLSRTDQKEKETQDAIINFVQSFGWMKAYATHLVALNSFGHFDFGSFSYVAPLQSPAGVIREKALSAEKELEEWERIVGSVRVKYPALNHFGMKLVWKFVEFLRQGVQQGFSPSESRSLIQKLIFLVNPVLAEKDHVIAEVENNLLSIWKSIACIESEEPEKDEDGDETMSLHVAYDGAADAEPVLKEREMLLADLLDCCGQTIQSVFGSLPSHSPAVELPDDVIPLSLKRGDLRLIIAKAYDAVFHEVFSCFAQCHTFPERKTLLLCREKTTWEEVFLLLLRWRFSAESDKVFAIANADLLSNEIQIKCVAFIQEFRTNQAPLLVICGPNRLAYVATQFANRRMPSFPLPRSLLQGLIEKNFNNQFVSYASDCAGAGKSFQIRKKCADIDGGSYVVIPASSLTQFLVLTKQALESERSINTESPSFFDDGVKSTCSLFLHIEVYDTVGMEINSFLFELLFFGGFCDFMSEEIFFYPPSSTSIAIEIPTGPLAKHLSVPSLCPVQKITASAEQFAPSKKDMIRGMGLSLFYGNRYDGTALRKREENVRHANAFDRLQYVAYALNILKETGGSFPFILETGIEEPEGLLDSLRLSASPGIGERDDGSICGSKCFDLIVEASQLEGNVSLWCLWNFINMVYWQLRDMHFPNSPLNMICMPTDPSEKRVLKKESNEAKMQMKGEILSFILKTAREFATRQSNAVDPNEIVGVEITGLDSTSRASFCGKWVKMGFTNCGRPVFRTKDRNTVYYFYYRHTANKWVIDDSIANDGPAYSYTEGSDWNMGVWRTTNKWKTDRDIKVTKIKHPNGYDGEALEATGFSLSECNGIYYRQPTYSDINGKPHYIKLEGERRHIFRDFMWFLCPVCTVDEGTLGTSTDLRRWNIKPPDTVETDVVVKEILRGDCDLEAPQIVSPGSNSEENDEDEELLSQKSEEFLEFLKLESLFKNTKRWADSNHESLLFSNTNHIVSFLSMNPDQMRDGMHPNLLEFLKNNKVNVGESLDQLSTRHHEVLGALTEVYRTGEDAKSVGGGSYCLTGDNLLKMLAIFIRLRVGIPVILMGECGCGKTSLLNYLCQWLGVSLMILDVHGGTTPLDILQIFEKAKRRRDLTKKPQYVFLDEVNACNHMGLICEVITKRSLYGVDIHNDIHILAALNPYRRRPHRGNTFGLVYKQKKGGVSPVMKDDMANLVYRVTPIPVALRDFVFDFGALGQDQEALYVKSMIQSQLKLPSLDNLEHTEAEKQKEKREKDLEIISGLVVESQKYIREEEGDPSSVSLRDVRRFLFFGNFFLGLKAHTDEWFVSSVIVSLALVYYFRLSSEKSRMAYWESVCSPEVGLNRSNNSSFRLPQGPNTHIDYFRGLLADAQQFFCSQVELGEGIALNAALTENLFVTIVCILNRVPVFLVGKPGTSKTLTLQIIASNLQGKQSPNPFWRKYPSVYVFPYQCSPMSDSGSIQQQFNMAVRYQEHATNTITVLLLDEVGLAEHSPDMPLKCLHGMLVDPPISIVGLSNWVLDPAKMNRAVLVQRPEPSHSDISQTGSSIMDISHGATETMRLLEKISRAYFRVYTNQKGRDFIGMRDYYSLVKSLRVELRSANNGSISKEQAIFAICRNFSGREDILKDVLFVMCEELYGNPKKAKMEEMVIGEVAKYYNFERPSLGELVRLNLRSSYDSRHLMLLTHNCAALSLVFSCDLVGRNDTRVIIGSEFVEDDTELYLIQQMNEVKLAMATGKTIVLMNADNMYEALYDVLNQRYLIKHDQATGKSVRLLRLAIGSRSSLCHVEPGFRIIVIAEKDYAYRELDLPLLNRFEKQILTPAEVLDVKGQKDCRELESWIGNILDETDLPSLQAVFCGFHPGTIPSLVFSLRQSKSKDVVTEAKKSLKRIASPAAVALSKSLLSVEGVHTHETLTSFVDELFEEGMKKRPAAAIATTYSPVTHLHEGNLIGALNAQVEVFRLDQVKSEKSFSDLLTRHLSCASSGANRLLIVQFDPIMCSSLQINHAKHLATTALSAAPGMKGEKVAILFLVHLPPGLRTRTRHFVLDFEIGWSYSFLDDVRGFTLSSDKRLDIPSLLRMPLNELFEKGVVNFKEIVSFQLPEAMYRLNVLTPPAPNPLPFMGSCDAFRNDYSDRTDVSKRIHSLKLMFEYQSFQDFFCHCVLEVLKDKGSLKDEKTGILLHVSLAIGESSGTLMESLSRVVSDMTLQVMINLLYIFEKNFTLGTLKSDPKLWMSFVVNKNVFDFEATSGTFKVGKRALRELQEKCAINTGKTQAFISKFPFSYAVFDLLNGSATRQAIESTLDQGATGLKRYELEIQVMEKTFSAFFGEEVVQYIHQKSECFGYFHDFVAMIAPQVDKLSFEEIEFVHFAVLQSFHPTSLSSPASIHAAFRQNERKVRIICSILSVLPDRNRQAVMMAMNEAANIPAHAHRTAAVLEAVFHELSKSVWLRAAALDFVNGELGVPCSGSSHLPILISSATESVNELLVHYEEEKEKIGDTTTGSPWNDWRSILLLKVFLETYEKERVQWGMGEKGKMIIDLLHDIDPSRLDSFTKLFVGLADFFSLIRPCIECTFISHVYDQNHVERDLCLRCANYHEIEKRKRVVERKVGGKTSLGQDFWDDFLLTPTQREGTLRDTREVGSLDSVASAVSSEPKELREITQDVDMFPVPKAKEDIVVQEATKRQAERIARRFLEVVVVRFFGEVLFSPSLPASKVLDVEGKLVSHVNSYLNAMSAIIPDVEFAPENLRQFLQFKPSPSTRLSLMHIFLRAEKKANVDEANRFFHPISPTGKLVYLSHCVSAQEEESKDIVLDSFEALSQISSIFSPRDSQIVLEWFANGQPDGWGSKRENLESLARVQVALRWYGTLIGSDEFPAENMVGTPELANFSQVFNNLLAKEKVLQTYVMKSIKEANSLEAVLSFLVTCRKKGCEWVQFDESKLLVVIEESPVGPWIPAKQFKELHEFRGLIVKAMAADNEEAFNTAINHSKFYSFIFPALFNEISHQAVLSQGAEEFLAHIIAFVGRVCQKLREKGGQANNTVAELLPLGTQIALLLKCGKSKSALLNRETIPIATEVGEELSSKAQALAYTLLRLITGALANPSSWLADLIMYPLKFSERYLPGSKFESPLDGVTWYVCPNGHSYSVGQCGRPMERGKCPTCGAEIGGQNHQNVKGVRQSAKPEDDFVNHLGYQVVVNERVNRLDTACSAFLRLIIDSALFLACFASEGKSKTSRLVHLRDVEACDRHMATRVRAHFQELCQAHRLDNMLGGVLVKAVFTLCGNAESLLWSDGSKFNHKNAGFSLENMIKPLIRNAAQDISSDIKFRIDNSNQAQQREEVVEKALGRESWDALLEKKTEDLTEGETMFTFVPPPTLKHFLVSSDSVDEFEEKYPLLSAFLEEEKRLQYVQYIIPVLEWHKLLFSVFQNGEINREEASNISNTEAVARLPKEDQAEGRKVMEEFCDAFNISFPLVGERLFECEENPFLKDGEVNLPGKMSPNTPISFSLPSISDGQKHIDPNALTTVRLLTVLHRIHEDCLGLGAQRRREGNEAGRRAGGANDQFDVGLPEISCDSPLETMRQKLILYDRGANFLSLLNTFSFVKGGVLQYDFANIQDGLRFGLLGGKQSTRLHTKFYVFRGDAQNSGQLSSLKLRVPQKSINDQTMQMILGEVDTQSKVIRLMSNLEVVINFVARIGGRRGKELGIGKMFVREYVLNSLNMDEERWDEASTPTIDEHIRLWHLSYLFRRLQVEMEGNPLDDLKPEFLTPLEEGQVEELRKRMESEGEMFSGMLRDALYVFILNKVIKEEWSAPELDLKEWLGYEFADAKSDVWFQEHFPDDMFMFEHAHALYLFLLESS